MRCILMLSLSFTITFLVIKESKSSSLSSTRRDIHSIHRRISVPARRLEEGVVRRKNHVPDGRIILAAPNRIRRSRRSRRVRRNRRVRRIRRVRRVRIIRPPSPTRRPPTPRPTRTPTTKHQENYLKVSEGQVTFDAEGNDNPKDKLYFSRRPHVPSRYSGVTIGRGYDMKSRGGNEVKKHLIAAGVDEHVADKFKNAVGLSGQAARDWLKKNNLQDFTLTRIQQKKLFEIVYPDYIAKAKRLLEKFSNNGLKYDDLSPIFKEIAVDIMYRGDYTMSKNKKYAAKKKRSERMQRVFDSKSLEQLKTLMSDKKFWKENGVDDNRFKLRKKAVERAYKKEQLSKIKPI